MPADHGAGNQPAECRCGGPAVAEVHGVSKRRPGRSARQRQAVDKQRGTQHVPWGQLDTHRIALSKIAAFLYRDLQAPDALPGREYTGPATAA